MLLEEFKKTVRTVNLGFFRHDATDDIVNVIRPTFTQNAVSRMPTLETQDFFESVHRIFPRRDQEMELLSRNVLSDLFWFCCCLGSLQASVSPSERRRGSEVLLENIRSTCNRIGLSTAEHIKQVGSALGGTLSNSDALRLATMYATVAVKKGAADATHSVCLQLFEPTLGDCSCEEIANLSTFYKDRASRAMHFLSLQGKMPDRQQDQLLDALCRACSELIRIIEPKSITVQRSSAWILELFTGVPKKVGVDEAAHGLEGAEASSRFSPRRSVYVGYEQQKPSQIEEMLSRAIITQPVVQPIVPRPPHSSNPNAPAAQYIRKEANVSKLRLAACSPSLATWFDSPRLRSGRTSQTLRVTLGLDPPHTTVSNSEFAQLSLKVFNAPSAPSSSPRSSPRPASLNAERQCRRDLLRLAKAVRCTRELTADILSELRVEMRRVLAILSSGKHAGMPDKSLTALLNLKDRFDQLFASKGVMSNISAIDRKDVLDRSVLLAKLIGEQRRVVSEQHRVNTVWESYTRQMDEELGFGLS